MEFVKVIFQYISRVLSFFQITDNGYLEHFIVGLLINGLISYLIFKQTSNKIKSIVFGLLITTFIGTVKELIDPYIKGDLDKWDLIYTFVGGVIGSSIILTKKNPNKMKCEYKKKHP